MATVKNLDLANQTVNSRWGNLSFDGKGECSVSDDIGAEIQAAGLKSFHVDLPIASSAEDLSKEELTADDFKGTTLAPKEEGKEEAPEKEEEKPKTKLGTPKAPKGTR